MTQQGTHPTEDWGSPTGWQRPPQEPYQQPAPGGRSPTKKRGPVIALVVAGGVVLVGIVVALVLTVGRGGSDAIDSPPIGDDTIPAATLSPDGLGSDAYLNELARDCYDGNMSRCDSLFLESGFGSAYEGYGDSCAGRQPEGTGVYCTDAFPG